MNPNYEEKLRQVEARRFDGDIDDMVGVVTWIRESYTWFDMFTPAPKRGVSMDIPTGFLVLVDADGIQKTAQKGDWVLLRPNGEFTAMTDEAFNATYVALSAEA